MSARPALSVSPFAVASCLVAWSLLLPLQGRAADFRSTSEPATILYDAPSAKGKPLFVLGRDTPLEVIVPLEGWVKVRDVGGSIGWVEQKSVSNRRMLVVRVPLADVRAVPDETAPVVFKAEHHVLLEAAEAATSAATTAAPGWVKVRHRDGQVGYVRVSQVFGL
jgi:SH3-like domain-containing protein